MNEDFRHENVPTTEQMNEEPAGHNDPKAIFDSMQHKAQENITSHPESNSSIAQPEATPLTPGATQGEAWEKQFEDGQIQPVLTPENHQLRVILGEEATESTWDPSQLNGNQLSSIKTVIEKLRIDPQYLTERSTSLESPAIRLQNMEMANQALLSLAGYVVKQSEGLNNADEFKRLASDMLTTGSSPRRFETAQKLIEHFQIKR